MKVFPISMLRTRASAGAGPWAYRNAAKYNNQGWNHTVYGNGIYLAFGGTGRCIRSTDGITWNDIHLVKDGMGGGSAAYGNGVFVTVASNYISGQVATSTDGITWTERTTPNPTMYSAKVVFGNGLFVLFADSGIYYGSSFAGNKIYTSPDGITWTARSHPDNNISTFGFWDAVYGDGKFVALCSTGGTSGYAIMHSTDGINWTKVTIPTSGSEMCRNIAYGNGAFVFNGYNTSNENQRMFKTTTLSTFSTSSNISGLAGGGSIIGLVYHDGLFKTAQNQLTIYTSQDGLTNWTGVPTGLVYSSMGNPNTLSLLNNTLVITALTTSPQSIATTS